jgi:hypothetical protein
MQTIANPVVLPLRYNWLYYRLQLILKTDVHINATTEVLAQVYQKRRHFSWNQITCRITSIRPPAFRELTKWNQLQADYTNDWFVPNRGDFAREFCNIYDNRRSLEDILAKFFYKDQPFVTVTTTSTWNK